MNKKKKMIIVSLISLFLIGSVLMLIGLYYWVIKAGIPYQDPTAEMLQRYYRDMRIGDITLLVGLGTLLIDIIGGVFYYFKVLRKSSKNMEQK